MRWSAPILAALALAGCDDMRFSSAEPAPQVVIEVAPGGTRCRFNGRDTDEDVARRDLARIVEGDRAPGTGRSQNGSRVSVRLVAQPGSDWRRVDDLVQYCQGLGINKIELPSSR